jgi:ribosomal protein L11 methyltransferase
VADYIEIFLKIFLLQIMICSLQNLLKSVLKAFEEEESNLKAFIPADNFDTTLFDNIIQANNLSFTKSIIKETNWNQLWESNFQPVIIDDFAAIRADFHKPIAGVKHEVIITPKMSFGTGHHATTCMMIQQMGEIDFSNKTILDFGTGTGILSILAENWEW